MKKTLHEKRGRVFLLFLFFAIYCNVTIAQDRQVTGKVIDAKTNETIIGASVKVKGSKTGATTDVNGAFRLNAPDGAILQINYIGYSAVEIAANFNNPMIIKLSEDNNLLQEVVVNVGYGTQKKATLTGSVATVDAKAFQEKGSLASPLQALQGQVPGVIITRSSSAPGDESWSMKLRGAVSVNGTEALVIIDGIAMDSQRELRLLNPSDIDNISFLEDGAAAIYGSRAAGGVVLVTTKKGKKGKTVVNYNGSYTRKEVGLQPRLMSLDEWANGVIRARTNDGFGAEDVWIRYANLALANRGGYIDLSKNANPITGAFTDVTDYVFLDNNWSDVLWGGANSTQNDLSVSGGNEKSTYRLSLGYLNDDGVLKFGNNTNKRYNLRLTNDFQVSDRLSIESVIAYSRQNQVSPTMLGSSLGQAYPQPGLPTSSVNGKPYAWGGQYTPNWFAELGGDNKLKVSSINISETIKYKIFKDLQFISNLGYNTSAANRDIQQNSIEWYSYSGGLVPSRVNPTPTGSYFQESNAQTDFYSVFGSLQYTKTIKQNHNLKAMVGAQYEYKAYDFTSARVTDINSSLSVLSGVGTQTTGKEKWEEAIGAYLGRFNYDYKSKYLLEVQGRYDGSSKFLRVNRWNGFYGGSVGWRISEEDLVKKLDIFNELKLRASYGIVGNPASISRYDGQPLYNTSSGTGAYLGAGKVSTITTDGRLVSYERTWERIHNYNLGLDFAVLRNKLSGTVEVFKKENNNMLITQTYSAPLGATAPEQNLGKFKGSGYNGVLNWADKIGNVTYRIGGVITYAKNRIIDLGVGSAIESGFKDKVQGYPLNSIFGLVYDGRIQSEEQRLAYLDKYNVGNGIGLSSAIKLGDNMYKDANGDGKLDINDLTYLGTDDPQLSYSFNAGAEFKGFDFSVTFQGAGERTTFRNDVNWRIPFRSVYLNTTNQSVGDNWTPENTGAHFPRYSTDGAINTYNYQASSWSVENGSYLRLKYVSLGYNLPHALVNKTKAFTKLRLYVTGSDLWEITKINDGWDPEATRTVTTFQRYPFNRFYTVGVQASF